MLKLLEQMDVTSFTVNSPLVEPGGLIDMRCAVANMDPNQFVQYAKIMPPPRVQQVLLTTNRNEEDCIKDLQRYEISATKNANAGYDFVLRINGNVAYVVGLWGDEVVWGGGVVCGSVDLQIVYLF